MNLAISNPMDIIFQTNTLESYLPSYLKFYKPSRSRQICAECELVMAPLATSLIGRAHSNCDGDFEIILSPGCIASLAFVMIKLNWKRCDLFDKKGVSLPKDELLEKNYSSIINSDFNGMRTKKLEKKKLIFIVNSILLQFFLKINNVE